MFLFWLIHFLLILQNSEVKKKRKKSSILQLIQFYKIMHRILNKRSRVKKYRSAAITTIIQNVFVLLKPPEMIFKMILNRIWMSRKCQKHHEWKERIGYKNTINRKWRKLIQFFELKLYCFSFINSLWPRRVGQDSKWSVCKIWQVSRGNWLFKN